MRATTSIVSFSVVIVLVALAGCTEGETGACISRDGANTYCFEDEEDFVCDGADQSFSPGKSCSAVGYSYFCTAEDMKASGSETVYAVSRYLDNSACNPGGGGGGSGQSSPTGAAYVQFYADPANFGSETGVVITGIEGVTEGGKMFSVESSKGNCERRIVVKGAVLQGSPSPRVQFRIHARNYNSLDTAFGAEYTEEEGSGVFYMSELEPGCNTLEVYRASTNRLSMRRIE